MLISSRISSLSLFFFGRKPKNVNFEEGSPLDARAVNAAHGPGIQIVLNPFTFVSFIRSSPGSQIVGNPASLTSATDYLL